MIPRKATLYEKPPRSLRRDGFLTEPERYEDAEKDGKGGAGKRAASFWTRIVAFFKTVGDFFRKIFKI